MRLLPRLLARIAPFPFRQIMLMGNPGGYLVETGWALSKKRRLSFDKDHQPLPWYTYPAIRFLGERARLHFRVFEFGSGHSTRWWQERTAEVVAKEHSREWVEATREILNGRNARVEYCDAKSSFYPAITDGPYHVIAIDGRRRVECCRSAVGHLTDDGVIVLDNSERDKYAEGRDFIAGQGFRHLDFWGIVPGALKESCTTVFYRDGNCLGI